MRLLFTLFFIIFNSAFGCALCALMTPTAHIYMDFKAEQERLREIEISWYFSANFTRVMLEAYDTNLNLKLDNDELYEIRMAMLDYLRSRNYLMKFEYYDKDSDEIYLIDGNFSSARFLMDDKNLVFKFSQNLDLDIKKDRILKIEAKDKEEFFNFKFLNDGFIEIAENFRLNFNPNMGYLFANFSDEAGISDRQKSKKEIVEASRIDSEGVNFLQDYSGRYLQNLKELFNSKESIFMVILVSFLYGFFHAAGPGHAKVLTTSYFLSSGGSLRSSFIFSLKISFFHVLGAFLIVVLGMFVSSLVGIYLQNNTIVLTTKISAIMIILVAVFIIYKKFRRVKIKWQRNEFGSAQNLLAQKTAMKQNIAGIKAKKEMGIWQNANRQNSKIFKENTHSSGCSCQICSGKKPRNLDEWIIALSSAIVPCPGTILVFLLAFNMGSYFICFVSAVFMGLGMAVVIFLAAIFGSSLNKFANFKNLRDFSEILGASLMLILGLFLFFISDNLGIL